MIAPRFLESSQRGRARRADGRVNELNETCSPPRRPVAPCCPARARNIGKQKSFAAGPESPTKGRYGPGSTQYPRRRGRPRDADTDREIFAYQRLQRDDGK